MRILKLLAASSIVMVCSGLQAGPVLQLGITNGSYDADAADIVTTDNIFTLNAYGKAKAGNAVSLDADFFLTIAILADAGLNPAEFGSFMLGASTYTISDMVFGSPPSAASPGSGGGSLGAHDIYDAWFMQHAFSFSDSSLTSNVNMENTPAFDPSANPGDDYYFKSFNVNTQGLASGYNLHFDLFGTKTNNKGNVSIDGHAPFSHDASTAYVLTNAAAPSVPEPATLIILGLALAGLFFSRKPAWLSPIKAKE